MTDYPFSARVRNHVLFWLVYVLFKSFLNIPSEVESAFFQSVNGKMITQLLLVQMCLLLVKVPMVYSCLYLLDRYFTNPRKLSQIIFSLILLFIVSTLLYSILNKKFILPYLMEYTGSIESIFSIYSLLYYLFTLLFVAGLACALHLIARQHTIEKQNLIIQKEKKETELNYLKAQINPHFLFNTLNNLYSLARISSPLTAEFILKLSHMMRFMLYDSAKDTIKLIDELRLIHDYIDLEKLRYTDRLHVSVKEEIDDLNQKIAPLILIHFVENAFKHGASESREIIDIQIFTKLKNGTLFFRTENSTESVVINSADDSQAIGLKNLKRQLQLTYPTHELKVESVKHRFYVHLTIQLC